METDAVIRTHAAPVTTNRYELRDRMHVDWAAILGGAVVAVGVWLAVHVAGVGIGLVAVDVDEVGSWRRVVIGTGVWGVIAPIVAFFVGGLVVGRTGRAVVRMPRVVNASVMWGVAVTSVILVLTMTVAGLVQTTVSGGASVAMGAAKVAGTAAAGVEAQSRNVADSLGLRASDALQPLNQRLRAEGKPAITTQQLELAAKDVVADAVRSGTLNHAMLVRSISNETALSDADAEDIANRVQTQYTKAKAQLDAETTAAKDKALRAAQATAEELGKVMIALFVAMMLALLAAIAGALLGGVGMRRERIRIDG